jgi:hypothetical protein
VEVGLVRVAGKIGRIEDLLNLDHDCPPLVGLLAYMAITDMVSMFSPSPKSQVCKTVASYRQLNFVKYPQGMHYLSKEQTCHEF